jgi:hypothetical protein
MMEFYGGKQAGITVIFYSDINAEGVRQFQPRVRAASENPGTES